MRKAEEDVGRKSAQPWVWAGAGGCEPQSRGQSRGAQRRRDDDERHRGPCLGHDTSPVPLFPEQQGSLCQICQWLPFTLRGTHCSYWPRSFRVAPATPTPLPSHLLLTQPPAHPPCAGPHLRAFACAVPAACSLSSSFLRGLGPHFLQILVQYLLPDHSVTLAFSTLSCSIFLPFVGGPADGPWVLGQRWEPE